MNEHEAFIKLKEMIHRERGLDVSQYKENYLKRRIAVRTRALSLKSYEEYINYLNSRPEEYNILLDKLTINVTQFFRDPEMFEAFEKNVLPEVFKKSRGGIKVWSAGCSSGEEPYTVAIAIEEAGLKAGIQNIQYEIYATDIDEAVLYRAVNGQYEGRTLENLQKERIDKYFVRDGNKYKASERIKKNIKFMRKNLMEPFKSSFFDIVLCRNVIIYFTKELQKTVMEFFHDSLKEGGVLILGKTETMLLNMRDKYKCIDIKERIFTKVTDNGDGTGSH
jgi:chemotaxis protein methyltransferase CheR